MTCDGAKRSVKVVTKKKALRSPGCTTVHYGGKSEIRSQKQRTETSKEDWTWQRGTTLHPLSEAVGGKCASSGKLSILRWSMLTTKESLMVHVDNKRIIDGLWRGEMKCMGPTAKDADFWILICEELHTEFIETAYFWRVEEGFAANAAL